MHYNFARKSNLVSLNTEVNKLGIDKLIPAPVDLSKLNDVVKNDGKKKTVYDKLVTKLNNIDTSGFVLKTKYHTGKSNLEKKIPDTSRLVKKKQIKKLKLFLKKWFSGLAATSALTAVEIKKPDV